MLVLLLDRFSQQNRDLNKTEDVLNSRMNEEDRRAKALFKKVWTFSSTREDIKGCTRQLDESFQLCMVSTKRLYGLSCLPCTSILSWASLLIKPS